MTCIDYEERSNRPVRVVSLSPRGRVTEIERDEVGLPVRWADAAAFRQVVTARLKTIVLEGGIRGGQPGVRQTVVVNRGAFIFGAGEPYP